MAFEVWVLEKKCPRIECPLLSTILPLIEGEDWSSFDNKCVIVSNPLTLTWIIIFQNLALKVATQSPRNFFNHVIFIIGVTTAQGKKGFCKLGIVEAVFGRDILALVQYAYYVNVFIMRIVIAWYVNQIFISEAVMGFAFSAHMFDVLFRENIRIVHCILHCMHCGCRSDILNKAFIYFLHSVNSLKSYGSQKHSTKHC